MATPDNARINCCMKVKFSLHHYACKTSSFNALFVFTSELTVERLQFSSADFVVAFATDDVQSVTVPRL